MPTQSFSALLAASWRRQNSLLCVGLDPDIDKMPRAIARGAAPYFVFSREIIDACAAYACAFKPQIAHYAARGAEAELAQTLAYIKQHYPHLPVILDAKRGDIGATAKMYAAEAFHRYQADAVTVNPYLGGDSLAPFLEYADGARGVFILCRTSNPGAAELQSLTSDGQPVFARIAQRAAAEWNRHGNVGLVAGATWPDEIATIRAVAGDLPLLIPGIGAQGGDLAAVLAAGLRADGYGILINVSRAILYAGDNGDSGDSGDSGNSGNPAKPRGDFFAAAAAAAENFHRQINQQRTKLQK